MNKNLIGSFIVILIAQNLHWLILVGYFYLMQYDIILYMFYVIP